MVLNGLQNCVLGNSEYSTIENGLQNCVTSSLYSHIGGGFCNIVSGFGSLYQFIGGGSCNTISSYYGNHNFIGTGQFNCININTSASILNGCANCVSSDYGQILNGDCNCIKSTSGFSTILNGQANIICDSSTSAILSGSNNYVTCVASVVLGGTGNCACGCYSAIYGCNIVNTISCSFKSNQLVAQNLVGGGAICSDANGVIVFITSDARLKKDVCDLGCSYGLNAVMKMKPITYYWCNTESNGSQRNIGFVAQDIMKILPETVRKTNSGFYSFDSNQVIPTLVKSIQELKSCFDTLKNK
jgi:hypothetical protein